MVGKQKKTVLLLVENVEERAPFLIGSKHSTGLTQARVPWRSTGELSGGCAPGLPNADGPRASCKYATLQAWRIDTEEERTTNSGQNKKKRGKRKTGSASTIFSQEDVLSALIERQEERTKK